MREEGYSLLELCICMLIIFILSTSTLVHWSFGERLAVQYETLYFVSELRYLKLLSANSDHAGNGVGMADTLRPRLVIDNGEYYFRQGMRRFRAHRPMGNLRIEGNQQKIQFHYSGATTAATIKIKGKKYGRKVVIDSVGRIRVEEE